VTRGVAVQHNSYRVHMFYEHLPVILYLRMYMNFLPILSIFLGRFRLVLSLKNLNGGITMCLNAYYDIK